MKVLVLFCTLLAFGAANEDECSNEVVEECVIDMLQLLLDADAQVDCKALLATEQCLLDFADKCLDEEERAEVQPHIDAITNQTDKTCDRFEDLATVQQCLEDEERLLVFVSSCGGEAFEKFTSGAIPLSGSLSDMNCIVLLSIARCVSKEVGNLCGKFVEKPFFRGMFSAFEQKDSRAATSPQCAAVSREIVEDQNNEVKRKQRVFQISNSPNYGLEYFLTPP